MGRTKCEFDSCQAFGSVHVCRIQDREIEVELCLCEAHWQVYLRDYFAGKNTKIPMNGTAIRFEPSLLIYDESRFNQVTSSSIFLREVDGYRSVSVPTGFFEASNLLWQLRRMDFMQPPLYLAVLEIIDRLNGKLDSIVIDDYEKDGQVFCAKIALSTSDGNAFIPCKTSDAFAIALAGNVPIWILRATVDKIQKAWT